MAVKHLPGERSADTGRRVVVAVIAATLVICVATTVAYNLVLGSERLPQQISRFLLTLGLCVFLYRGASWARWVAGVLFFLAGGGGIVLALLFGGVAGIFLMAMGVVYAASGVALLGVPAVDAYFKSRRARSA